MPYKQAKNPVAARTLLVELLAALSARPAAALLVTPTVHLYTAATTPPNPNSTDADFTECTFNGYAPVALGTVTGPVNLPSGDGVGVTVEADFIAGGGAVPPGETALGYWIDDGATPVVHFYAAEQFDAPVPFVLPGDFLSLDVVFPQAFITPVT